MSEESVHFLFDRVGRMAAPVRGIYRIPATIMRHGRGRTSGNRANRATSSRRRRNGSAVLSSIDASMIFRAGAACGDSSAIPVIGVSDARLSCVTRRGHGAALVAFRRKGILA